MKQTYLLLVTAVIVSVVVVSAGTALHASELEPDPGTAEPKKPELKKSELNEQFLQRKGQAVWKTIAVFPFTGPPHHARVFSEYFSVLLLQQHSYAIISPAIAEIELKKRGALPARGIRSVQEARDAGQILNADAVVMGSFGQVRYEWIVTTKLIDMATGEQVAEIARPDQVPMHIYDQHHLLTELTESAAADMLAMLRALSGEQAPRAAGPGSSDDDRKVPQGEAEMPVHRGY